MSEWKKGSDTNLRKIIKRTSGVTAEIIGKEIERIAKKVKLLRDYAEKQAEYNGRVER